MTLGGLAVRAGRDLLVVTTGARCAGPSPHAAPILLRRGQELRLGAPAAGLRTYLAVRGGLAVPAVLGSRSTDLLSGLGPPVVAAGDELPVGAAAGEPPGWMTPSSRTTATWRVAAGSRRRTSSGIGRRPATSARLIRKG